MLIVLRAGPAGAYLVEAPDGRSVLINTDWDFPPLARAFGWNGKYSARAYGSDLGAAARAARDWLGAHVGRRAEDPGYFDHQPLPEQRNLSVDLASTSASRVPRRTARCGSLREASAVVRQYVNQYGLGPRQWAGGTVRQGKRPVARVSHDGRVWSTEGREKLVYEPAGGSSKRRGGQPSTTRRPVAPECGCRR
jgi:hypothetical protein